MKFVVLGEPFGKQRPRYTKFGRAYTPKETVNYESLVKVAYMDQIGMDAIISEGNVYVEINAYFKIPKNTSKKKTESMIKGYIRPTKKPDVDNIAKIILDALNGVAYSDDTQVVEIIVTKSYSETPRVEITIAGE